MPDTALLAATKNALLTKYGEAERARIERGVTQVASLWVPTDGDLQAFALDQFVADAKVLDVTLKRLETTLEVCNGHFIEIGRELRWDTDTDTGPLLPLDPLLAGIDPSAHLLDDLFAAKVGFVVLLNFPLTTLAERLAHADAYSRRDWAERALAALFGRRVPAEVQQEIARVGADADLYIAQYNLWMHHVVNDAGERLFPKGMRLISHWNLRDELKADYTDPRGLDKQRLITKVMERIVTQSVPAAVIDNPRVDWNPVTNKVSAAPQEFVEADAPARAVDLSGAPEPDTRYAQWLRQFQAGRRADPYSPLTPTLIARSFELGRQISEERVLGLFEQVLTSPVAAKVAALMQTSLAAKQPGRKLEPHDIWYNGLMPRGAFSESELDKKTRARYPSAAAFAADIPRILSQLGFAKDRVKFITERIVVDAARGAGHAMPAGRRGDFPRLRTRIGQGGMDYKGYNIAVHELGHNVEQVESLYNVDRVLLAGVPNTAFTEALAFVFQARDVELLGLTKPDAASERRRVINDFWMTFEIAGVALLDNAAWHWLYEHPNATAAELRVAVVAAAKQIWNRYYEPLLGGKDSVLLAVYSHLIAYPLYVADYPLGHLIAFQIEEHLQKAPALGVEFERMASFGAVAPDVWMKHATGAAVSAEPLLRATEQALAGL